MSGEVRVDTRELDGALDKLTRDVETMPEAWRAVGDVILPGVRDRTPVRSGSLRDSWTAEPAGDRVGITSELPYARMVETINAPVAGTITASEREIVEALEAELARAAAAAGFEVRR